MNFWDWYDANREALSQYDIQSALRQAYDAGRQDATDLVSFRPAWSNGKSPVFFVGQYHVEMWFHEDNTPNHSDYIGESIFDCIAQYTGDDNGI